MLVQLHIIGSQAFTGRPPSTISTIQAVVESWQAGKILHASYEYIKLSLEHKEIELRCIVKLLKGRIDRHLRLL